MKSITSQSGFSAILGFRVLRGPDPLRQDVRHLLWGEQQPQHLREEILAFWNVCHFANQSLNAAWNVAARWQP